jgi:SAM-dependent methyltransferase
MTTSIRASQPVSEHLLGFFGGYLQGPSRLNLGTARNHEPGFLSLDKSDKVGADVVWDLERVPLPFADATFDVILGAHVFEHIAALVPLVRDLHRITKPGGYLISVTPYVSSNDATANPFHLRAFDEHTWGYFNQGLYARDDHAGSGDFGIDFTWRVEETTLVPYPEFVNDPELDVKRRHLRNVIREVHVVMQKEA